MVDQPDELESCRNKNQNDLADGEAEILAKGGILQIGNFLKTGTGHDHGEILRRRPKRGLIGC